MSRRWRGDSSPSPRSPPPASQPQPLGLGRRLAPANQQLLASGVYAGASPSVRLLEEEAFAHQDDLSLGATLLARHCGNDDLPGRLGP